MKKTLQLSLFTLSLLFVGTTPAMEGDKKPLEDLQKIIKPYFKFAQYNVIAENIEVTKNINSTDENPDKTFFQSLCSFQQIEDQNDCFFFKFSKNIQLSILHLLSTKDLVQAGRACKKFYVLTRPAIYFNTYCFQEYLPHSLPVDRLVEKVKSTPGSLFKLAELYSVTATDLCNWFGQPYLESAIQENELPESFKNLNEKEQWDFYPVVKVIVAATAPETERALSLQKLFEEVTLQLSWQSPFEVIRLCSIQPVRLSRFNALSDLLKGLTSWKKGEVTIPSHLQKQVDAVAYQLLTAGHNLPSVNQDYDFYYQYALESFEKKEMTIKVIRWCYENTHDFSNSHILISHARDLKEHQLVFDLLQRLINLPNKYKFSQDQFETDLLLSKICSFPFYVSDERVKEQINIFTHDLYKNHWLTLGNYLRKDALRLFIRTSHYEIFKTAFKELLSNPCMVENSNDQLLQDLCTYGLKEEAKQLAQLILDSVGKDEDWRLPSIYNVPSFADCAKEVGIDHQQIIGILKKYIEVPCEDPCDTIEALTCLAKYAKDTEFKYIMEKTASLKGEGLSNKMFVYYYLGETELCKESYQISIEEMIREESQKENSKVLRKFKKGGINITSLEDLRNQNAFEIIEKILLVLEKRKNKK